MKFVQLLVKVLFDELVSMLGVCVLVGWVFIDASLNGLQLIHLPPIVLAVLWAIAAIICGFARDLSGSISALKIKRIE